MVPGLPPCVMQTGRADSCVCPIGLDDASFWTHKTYMPKCYVLFWCSGARHVQQSLRGSTATSAHGQRVQNHVQSPSWDL